METSRIQFSVHYNPGKSHFDSIRNRCANALESGLISCLPSLSFEPQRNEDCFATIFIDCPKIDQPFWIGFYEGISFCRNNIEITMGERN